jgi:hypothetical protein
MPAEPIRDEHEGWCASCRNDQHILCVSIKCACAERGAKHPRRPTTSLKAVAPTPAAPAAPAEKPVKAKGQPRFEFWAAEPPAPAKSTNLGDRVETFLAAHAEELATGAWYQLLVYPANARPGGTAGRLQRRLGIGWEVVCRTNVIYIRQLARPDTDAEDGAGGDE